MKIRRQSRIAAGPVLALLLSSTVVSAAQDPASADLIVINGKVVTLDADQPAAEALAVTGNRITALGDTATIKKRAGEKTRVIDAQGRLVLPGFNDSHVHFLAGGRQLSSVDLRDANAEFQEDQKGTLAPGKLADLVVLSRNLFEIPRAEIKHAFVVVTVVDGKVVFESGK